MHIFIYTLLCFLVFGGMGCRKGQKELVSFADQIVPLQSYNETLVRYVHLIQISPEHPGEAHQVGSVLQEYHEAVSGIPRPRDLALAGLHRRYIRALEKARERIRSPEDPSFSADTQWAIASLQSEVEKIYETLEEILQRENLGDRYTLKWPSTEERP